MRLALLSLVSVALLVSSGCHSSGGGGGQTPAQKGSLSAINNLSMPDERGFQDAYSLTPRVHADVASGHWTQALDELTAVDREVTLLERADSVSPGLKTRIGLVRPVIHRLAGQIRQHDQASVHTARALVGAFSAVTNDPAVRTWMHDKGTREVKP